MKDSNKNIIGIFSYPWRNDFDEKNPFELYRKAVHFKANPRSEDYLKALFLAHYPGGVFINIDGNAGWNKDISSAEKVIVLYPDSIGMGFLKIESEIFKYKRKSTSVYVLNGRKRKFFLNNYTRAQLYLRRFIEHYMLGEIFITIAFLFITPFFLIGDLARRRW